MMAAKASIAVKSLHLHTRVSFNKGLDLVLLLIVAACGSEHVSSSFGARDYFLPQFAVAPKTE